MQPVDRKNAKHAIKTAPRNVPQMVKRTNKTILGEIAPRHEAPRYWGWHRTYWRSCN
jgi:hypothetical protein